MRFFAINLLAASAAWFQVVTASQAAAHILKSPLVAGSVGRDRRILHPHPTYDVPFHHSTSSGCGFESDINFRTWYKTIHTDSPVLFPKNEAELVNILERVVSRGCRLRVRGAGHSEDGLVMQSQDQGVVTVNLKDMAPPEEWNGVIREGDDSDKATIKISAGASLLEMISISRPLGWLPFTSYPLPSFSVGGAYLNPSTHGQTYGEGRLASQVVGARVLHADGTFKEYSMDDPALVDIRGSMGLLGIVTALEIRLRRDTGLAMRRDQLQIAEEASHAQTDAFNETRVGNFLLSKLTENNGTDFFYHPQEDLLVTFELHFDGDASFDPNETIPHYSAKTAKFPDLAFTGGTQVAFVHVIGVLAEYIAHTADAAQQLGETVRTGAESQFDENAKTMRDGFWVDPDHVNGVEIIFYSVKCAEEASDNATNRDADGFVVCLEELLHLFKISREFLLNVQSLEDNDWYPTFPLEWRLFTVGEDEMTLEHLTPGTYIGFENLAIRGDDLVFTKYHKQLEDMWRRDFPEGGIHHGKQYGYGTTMQSSSFEDANDVWFPPFQNDTILNSIYSDHVKATFREKMLDFDPHGTFQAGSVLRLLEMTDKKFVPVRKKVEIRDFLSYAQLPRSVLILELALLALLALLPFYTFVWYRLARKKACNDESPSKPDWPSRSIEASRKSLPLLYSKGLRLSWNTKHCHDVMNCEEFWLGGCKLTALRGASGSGKSSLMHLLAGYPASHMTLSMGERLSSCKIVLCPQTPDMWPDEMSVRDILLFACSLYGSDPSQCLASVSSLGIFDLFDKPFGSLSGGQRQLVSIASAIAYPTPALVFLDEPTASLDKGSALNLIQSIKAIPTHSFVISAHALHDEIAKEFDRTITLSNDEHEGFKSTAGFDSIDLSVDETKADASWSDSPASPENGALAPADSDSGTNSVLLGKDYLCMKVRHAGVKGGEAYGSKIRKGFKAIIVLWHAQCYGWPLVELALALISLVGAALFGAMTGGSVAGESEASGGVFIPYTSLASYPMYYSGVLVGIAFNTALTLPLIYGVRERKLLAAYLAQKTLHPASLLLAHILRCAFIGILQSTCWLLVFMPLVKMWGSTSAELVANTSIFVTSWALFTTWIGVLIPQMFAPHVLLLLTAYAHFLSGGVTYGTAYPALQAVCYISPLFYMVSCGCALILYDLQTGCDDGWNLYYPEDISSITPGNLFDTIREGLCASGWVAYNATGLPKISSGQAQAFSFALATLSVLGLWFSASRQSKRYKVLQFAKEDNSPSLPACNSTEFGVRSLLVGSKLIEPVASDGSLSI